MTTSKTVRYRWFINRIISFLNRGLSYPERLPLVPVVPLTVSGTTEEVVWKYYNLLMAGYADWHDNGSARKDEIVAAKDAIEAEWGERLREYLEPYKDISQEAVTGGEYHRARVAADLFRK